MVLLLSLRYVVVGVDVVVDAGVSVSVVVGGMIGVDAVVFVFVV